jgi:hypothetical protein
MVSRGHDLHTMQGKHAATATEGTRSVSVSGPNHCLVAAPCHSQQLTQTPPLLYDTRTSLHPQAGCSPRKNGRGLLDPVCCSHW